MWNQAGNCPKCGAPIYMPMFWHGICPPSPTYTCHCVDTGIRVVTTTTSTTDVVIKNK